MKKFSSHIRFERLVDLVEDRLSADEQSQIVAHLASCPQCTAEKAWLERVIGLMRADNSESAPAAAIDRTLRLFQARQAKAAPRERRRIFALLQFDNTLPPLAFGLRSGQAQTHQRLYSAGDFDLDLRLKPAGEKWVVSGQLLGPATSGQAELRGESTQVKAELNELSEFTLTAVPSGLYTLILHLDEIEIEVTTLELG
ncbi:MAG: zf-HC2 domain-containing protein [Anaerolineaceae bacterium]|nr:zf-HC2 domain-containing protein [Anaerolineaceae bacterium]